MDLLHAIFTFCHVRTFPAKDMRGQDLSGIYNP